MAKKQSRRNEGNAITRYFRETSGELRKVSWPSQSEAIGLTRIVILVMIVMAAVLGGLDWAFFRFFGYLLGTGG
jgi:preprotein translocase subunit SecE